MADLSKVKIGSTTYNIKDATARDATKKASLSLNNYTAIGGLYNTTSVRFTVHTNSQLKPASAKLVLSAVRVRACGLYTSNYTDKGTLTASSSDLSNGSASFTLTGIAPVSGSFTSDNPAAVLLTGTLNLTY